MYFSFCNQAKKKSFKGECDLLTVIYTDFALCTLHLKQESDKAKKRFKALKINTTEICKYPFNVNDSIVGHI
jgi:hypothetical protein